MMTPQEFFRKAAEERRDLLVSLAVTGIGSALQELVASERPVQDTSVPQEAGRVYCTLANRYQYIRN